MNARLRLAGAHDGGWVPIDLNQVADAIAAARGVTREPVQEQEPVRESAPGS